MRRKRKTGWLTASSQDIQARVDEAIRLHPEDKGEHTLVPGYRWYEFSSKRINSGCGFAVCKTDTCWLQLYRGPDEDKPFTCKFRNNSV